MAILNNNPLVGASGNQGGYNINNSLRFRSSASAYLSRTPASAGNRKTFTVSFWFKRGTLSVDQKFLSAYSADSDSGNMDFRLTSGNILYWGPWNTGITTTAVFRDPSAWYHIVLAIDTTQATGANRHRVYVNGVEYTFSGTPVTQNTDLAWNNTVAQNIGRNARTSGDYLDGYFADFYNIDGQALTPSSFGETDTTTGVWKPKAYSGTYGTNGFYLKFSDIATTSGSNAGLGKDFSGNSNYWTTNNISVTAGTTYDAMTDSPTNTSATVANYCTWNPLVSPRATYSNGNLRFVGTDSEVWISPTIGVSSGKFYWETTVEAISSTILHIGITQLNGAINESGLIARSYYGDGTKYSFQTGTVTGTSFGNSYGVNDIIQVALDMDSGKVWFGKNNTWQASGNPSAGTNEAYSGLSGTFGPFAGKGAVGNQPTVVLNCGQRPFAYTPPTGFVALNTFNLPTPTILQGNKYMDATLYTGNGSSQTITNASGFRPDLVWVKTRVAVAGHQLVDSVRGVSKPLGTDNTSAEFNASPYNVTAFNSNGFSVADISSGANGVNGASGGTYSGTPPNYVAWQWQAGQGTNTTNTAGTVTSTVSVNATAGFSIVLYTGNGGAMTMGHGLGVAPKLIILKDRDVGRPWPVYHGSLATNQYLILNTTAAAATSTSYWNNTAPTSTVFSVNGLEGNVGANGEKYVAYCWAEIAGFSRFGSYTGNGSTDGTFVYTGFRPKYILIKRTNLTEDWYIYDTSRITYNLGNIFIYADLSDAEGTGSTGIDILSNGFKQRQTGGGNNASGSTYIYMAFAENPFKNALAR